MPRQWKIAEKFSINYYPDLGARFPRYRNSWNNEVSTFRVTGFYKMWVKPERVPSDDPKKEMLYEIMQGIYADERASKSEAEKLFEKFQVVLEACEFHEAEFIHGQSVSYPTVPIEWCNYLGDVGWEPEHLERSRQEYQENLERRKQDLDRNMFRTKQTHPRFDDAYFQLRAGGLTGGDTMENDEYRYYSEWCSKFSDKEYYEILSPDEEDEE